MSKFKKKCFARLGLSNPNEQIHNKKKKLQPRTNPKTILNCTGATLAESTASPPTWHVRIHFLELIWGG